MQPQLWCPRMFAVPELAGLPELDTALLARCLEFAEKSWFDEAPLVVPIHSSRGDSDATCCGVAIRVDGAVLTHVLNLEGSRVTTREWPAANKFRQTLREHECHKLANADSLGFVPYSWRKGKQGRAAVDGADLSSASALLWLVEEAQEHPVPGQFIPPAFVAAVQRTFPQDYYATCGQRSGFPYIAGEEPIGAHAWCTWCMVHKPSPAPALPCPAQPQPTANGHLHNIICTTSSCPLSVLCRPS